MEIVLSLMMLVAFALMVGGWVLWRKTGEAKKPLLMLVMAIILLANVGIWSLPDEQGRSLLNSAPEQSQR